MIQAYRDKTNSRIFLGMLLCFSFLMVSTLINWNGFLALLGIPKVKSAPLIITRLIHWFCLLLMWLYALKFEKQDFLLWKNQKYKIPQFILHIVLLYFTVLIIVVPVRLVIHKLGFNHVSAKLNVIKLILLKCKILLPFIAITAGVVEEYIFRGYIQPRLQILFKSPFAAILVSAILFGAVHYGYGTLDNVVGPFVIGLLFALYYWKFRNIYVLIACHTIIDLIALNALLVNH